VNLAVSIIKIGLPGPDHQNSFRIRHSNNGTAPDFFFYRFPSDTNSVAIKTYENCVKRIYLGIVTDPAVTVGLRVRPTLQLLLL
jgi:hypothetical protein